MLAFGSYGTPTFKCKLNRLFDWHLQIFLWSIFVLRCITTGLVKSFEAGFLLLFHPLLCFKHDWLVFRNFLCASCNPYLCKEHYRRTDVVIWCSLLVVMAPPHLNIKLIDCLIDIHKSSYNLYLCRSTVPQGLCGHLKLTFCCYCTPRLNVNLIVYLIGICKTFYELLTIHNYVEVHYDRGEVIWGWLFVDIAPPPLL